MDWWQLAIAVVTGGGLTAIVNAIANRHNTTATVYESISKSAATISEISERRINQLYDRLHEMEEREKAQRQDLIDLRSEIDELREELSGKDTKITEQTVKIQGLEAEILEKEVEIENLRRWAANLETGIFGRQCYDPRYSLKGDE